MRKEYISTEEFTSLLTEIHQKIEEGEIAECDNLLKRMLAETRSERCIDRAYIGNLKEKKRDSRIKDINRMLVEMSLEQIENVHKYTLDEFDEPNHEAEALEAVIEISRRRSGKQERVDAE